MSRTPDHRVSRTALRCLAIVLWATCPSRLLHPVGYRVAACSWQSS